MVFLFPKESDPAELRAALVPENVGRWRDLGGTVLVESGLGRGFGRPDADFLAAGAELAEDGTEALAVADLVLRCGSPPEETITYLKPGSIHISFLDPIRESAKVKALAQAGVSAFSMEMIPRSTLAQKMDALSSQANLAGYVAVILAAERLNRIFPMMMTPAGTLAPARVLVIGAGVAGLQAIATAKRLGARVEAFDTRPGVAEQVASLGAKFIQVNLGETGQTAQGYAQALTEDQLASQREAMAARCAAADVVITTAQVFGREAPKIVTAGMLSVMKAGSVVVDLAADSGGNVEGTRRGEEVDIGGVRLIGLSHLPGRVAADASLMYSNNLLNLVTHLWNPELKRPRIDRSDPIVGGCLVTDGGSIVNPALESAP